MRLDAWPTRAQFRPEEPVGIEVRVTDATPARGVPLSARISALGIDVTSARGQVETSNDGCGQATLFVQLPPTEPPSLDSIGYGVEVIALKEEGGGGRATTAFDVAPHWSAAPRYGFAADFAPDEEPAESMRRADEMLKLHANVIQFYDWMASHHTFLPATEEFVDPLGRRLSHAVVRRKVELARERGMAALAYGALYGAEADFSDAHPDWLLYDGAEQPLRLADLFYLQDFSEGSPWRDWIIGQYEQAVAQLGFDGIHIDQYGFPKRALSRASGTWRQIDVGDRFPGFVDEAASRVLALKPEGGSIFNCVNAWPLEGMARASRDAATYIEVWEPHVNYRDIYELVSRARLLRPNKQVILAAYLRPFHPQSERSVGALNAFRLVSATIHASGGFHLIAGEGNGLLAEAYYPRYGLLEADELAVVRRYADYVVRNTRLLHGAVDADIAWTHVGPANEVIVLDHPQLTAYGAGARPNSLWLIARESDGRVSLHLVNLRGIASDAWNAEQPQAPDALEGIEVRAKLTGTVEGVWWDTPDDDVGLARALPFEVVTAAGGRVLTFRLPLVEFWSTVWWQTTGDAR